MKQGKGWRKNTRSEEKTLTCNILTETGYQDFSTIDQTVYRKEQAAPSTECFLSNRRLFYRSLETMSGNTDMAPDKKEIKQFSEGIWSVKAKHNPRASQIEKLRTKMKTLQQQQDFTITVKYMYVRNVLRKGSNWKAAGTDSPSFTE